MIGIAFTGSGVCVGGRGGSRWARGDRWAGGEEREAGGRGWVGGRGKVCVWGAFIPEASDPISTFQHFNIWFV